MRLVRPGALGKKSEENRTMPSLLIVGAGGYGQLVREIAEINGYEKIDFLDDISPLAVGKIDELEARESDYDASIVAIGNSVVREEVFSKLQRPVTLIHPTAVVSSTATLGHGCVIEANAVVNSEAVIGTASFICAGAVVNHNTVVNEFCQIDCNAVVGSGAEVVRGIKVLSCTVYKKIEMVKLARVETGEADKIDRGTESFFKRESVE
jgi:NDP-sugar pyrophosphorylase family protein